MDSIIHIVLYYNVIFSKKLCLYGNRYLFIVKLHTNIDTGTLNSFLIFEITLLISKCSGWYAWYLHIQINYDFFFHNRKEEEEKRRNFQDLETKLHKNFKKDDYRRDDYHHRRDDDRISDSDRGSSVKTASLVSSVSTTGKLSLGELKRRQWEKERGNGRKLKMYHKIKLRCFK